MNFILVLIFFHTAPEASQAVSHGWYKTVESCERDRQEMLFVHGIENAYCVVVR